MLIDNGEDRHNRPVKYGLTAADRQRLVERHFETAQLRQAESDLNLLKAVKRSSVSRKADCVIAVRSMLARVARLEQGRASSWLRLIGPIEEFEADVQAGIAEGKYDPRDMPLGLASVQKWVREGSWQRALFARR